jgi:hypothetical protein
MDEITPSKWSKVEGETDMEALFPLGPRTSGPLRAVKARSAGFVPMESFYDGSI